MDWCLVGKGKEYQDGQGQNTNRGLPWQKVKRIT